MFGIEIRAARKAACWTQGTLAEKAGVSLQLISDIERGRCNPSLDTLHSITEALGLRLVLAQKKEDHNNGIEKGRPATNLPRAM